MKNQKYQYIFSLRLAGFLMLNGQRIICINHNLKYRDKDVYVFKKNEDIEKLIDEYNKSKKQIGESICC